MTLSKDMTEKLLTRTLCHNRIKVTPSPFSSFHKNGLFQDSNIGIPDIEGKTPLHWAASSKDPEAVNCVKIILVRGLKLEIGHIAL